MWLASLALFTTRPDLLLLSSYSCAVPPPSRTSPPLSAANFLTPPPIPATTFLPPPSITLPFLFSNLTPLVTPSSFSLQPPHLSSSFLPNPNNYVALALQQSCMLADGRLLLVGISADHVSSNLTGPHRIPSLNYLWHHLYSSCGNQSTDECTGVVFSDQQPTNFTWIPGNTLHFIPYARGNTFHNFAERIWPRLASWVSPLNATTPGQPVHRLLIHRLAKFIEQASRMADRDQILWQARMLMEIWPGSDLLKLEEFSSTICFETFLLQMYNSDRIDHTKLGPEISGPALRKYRAAIFRFLGLPLPQIRPPPEHLRLLYYGRSDTSRRRVMNNDEVFRYLQHNVTRPKLEVRSLDELLRTQQADYTFLSAVSLFSQTDILVVAHGAFTWATLFMPEGSAVVEVFGPCDFSKPRGNFSIITNLGSWIKPIAAALHLKHDLSNPYRDPVPNPRRGNTTLCLEPFTGVPDYTVDPVKVAKIVDSFGYPKWPGDRLTLHWLHDWGS